MLAATSRCPATTRGGCSTPRNSKCKFCHYIFFRKHMKHTCMCVYLMQAYKRRCKHTCICVCVQFCLIFMHVCVCSCSVWPQCSGWCLPSPLLCLYFMKSFFSVEERWVWVIIIVSFFFCLILTFSLCCIALSGNQIVEFNICRTIELNFSYWFSNTFKQGFKSVFFISYLHVSHATLSCFILLLLYYRVGCS